MFARTARLTLRPAWPEDAPALVKAIAHESVVTKLALVPWPYTDAHAAEFLARPETPDHLFRLVFAHGRQGARLIGGIGLHARGEERELGYWFTPSAWGQGYATEAGRAMLDIARHGLGLKRLVSAYFLDNPASGRVLAKLGFREVGREMRDCVARGGQVPGALAVLDWAERGRTG